MVPGVFEVTNMVRGIIQNDTLDGNISPFKPVIYSFSDN